jgi:hypothetical protein
MKCFVFSIGEPTTELCVELMESYGFEVVLYQDDTSLWDKLKRFYTEALESEGNHFMRIDADIIPNANVKKLTNARGWKCAVGYDWYKQDRGAISIHVMSRNIIKKCLEHIEEARDKIRPETYLWRLPEVNKSTGLAENFSCGIHGYGQKEHRERIKTLKYNREQKYDWELIEKIEAL